MAIDIRDYTPDAPEKEEHEIIYLELQRISEVLIDIKDTLEALDIRLTALEP